jgi:4-amino-4-deoxychorismate lyase
MAGDGLIRCVGGNCARKGKQRSHVSVSASVGGVPSLAVLALLGPDGPYLADAAEPVVRADDLGLLRGEGIFETLRVIGGIPVDLPDHVDRLSRSARAVDVQLPDASAIIELARLAIAHWSEPDGVLRLVSTKGSDTAAPVRFALITPLPSGLKALRAAGIAVVTLALGVHATARAQAPWLLGGVKATSYAVAMASQRAASLAGAADAIWMSSDGEVLEAPTSTVLIAQGTALLTPPAAELGLLPGLTLNRLKQLVDVTERRITRHDLVAADEILLASSVRGVVPVVSLDGQPRRIGAHGTRLPSALEASLRDNPA